MLAVNTMQRELRIRNLIARTFYGEKHWESCDIPARALIDEFILKLEKIDKEIKVFVNN